MFTGLYIKKINIAVLVYLFIFLFIPCASAQNSPEQIIDYRVDIIINSDATLNIIEEIQYDFGENSRHGIFRTIPYRYWERGGRYVLDIDQLFVTDRQNNYYNFSVTSHGSDLAMKIGDPDKFVTGVQFYRIAYRVDGAINYFQGNYELYWNAIGNDWLVPINNVSIRVHAPNGVLVGDIQMDCFPKSGRKCFSDSYKIDGDVGVVFSSSDAGQGGGITIVAGWPKGHVYEPSNLDRVLKAVRDNAIVLLPLIIGGILLYLWYSQGRDPKGDGLVIAQYDPPDGLTPSEIGVISDERVDHFDVSAAIIDLAVHGYINITRISKQAIFGSSYDFRLELLKSIDDELLDFEQSLLLGIFGLSEKSINPNKPLPSVNLSSLERKFYNEYKNIISQVYTRVAKDGYFLKRPDKVRTTYITIAIFVAFIAIFSGAYFGYITGISVGLSAGLIMIFGFIMPVRTRKGVRTKEYIFGLREYLNVTEKDRLRFHNAPEKSPKEFERLLPYAIALRVEKQWAELFENMLTKSPSWYNDPRDKHFHPVFFVSHIHEFAAKTNTTLKMQSRHSAAGGSSGFSGGSSGGGFGGGGGGSW